MLHLKELFVYLQCFVYQLKQESLSPGQTPQLSAVGAEGLASVAHHENWLSYMKWANTLTNAIHTHFLKAAELGVHILEPYIVSNAAVYLWNYNHYSVEAGMWVELVPTFRRLLALIRKLSKSKYAATVDFSCLNILLLV